MNALIISCRFIAGQLAPITLLGAVAAYLHPPLFLIFRESFLWFFDATMFAMGIVLDTGELQETLRRPGRIGLGVLTVIGLGIVIANLVSGDGDTTATPTVVSSTVTAPPTSAATTSSSTAISTTSTPSIGRR